MVHRLLGGASTLTSSILRKSIFLMSVLTTLVLVNNLAVGQQPTDTPPRAEGPEALPDGRTEYLGREIAQTMHYLGAPWLIRESREREEECSTMLRELKIRPGMVICDMGCGNGFYALQMARQAGAQGKVLAVDIQPEMLRLLQARAEEAGVSNVETVLGTLLDPKLPTGTVDVILCVDVYHEFSHPVHMLAAMRQSLKPCGVMVLVEYREEDPKVPIKPLHKMSKKQVLKEMSANGFRLAREFDGLPWQHMMFFSPDPSFHPDGLASPSP